MKQNYFTLNIWKNRNNRRSFYFPTAKHVLPISFENDLCAPEMYYKAILYLMLLCAAFLSERKARRTFLSGKKRGKAPNVPSSLLLSFILSDRIIIPQKSQQPALHPLQELPLLPVPEQAPGSQLPSCSG